MVNTGHQGCPNGSSFRGSCTVTVADARPSSSLKQSSKITTQPTHPHTHCILTPSRVNIYLDSSIPWFLPHTTSFSRICYRLRHPKAIISRLRSLRGYTQ
ncbi:hypothetical protein ACFX1X_027732 [Malus domestica]